MVVAVFTVILEVEKLDYGKMGGGLEREDRRSNLNKEAVQENPGMSFWPLLIHPLWLWELFILSGLTFLSCR